METSHSHSSTFKTYGCQLEAGDYLVYTFTEFSLL